MFVRIGWMEVPTLYMLLLVSLVVGVMGVVSAVYEVGHHWEHLGYPFSCQVLWRMRRGR